MPWLLSKKRRQSPSSTTSGQPRAATSSTSASELRENGLGRLHRAAARGDLAWLRRWRWYVKVVGIDRRDQEMRTPLHLASANGHADVLRYLLRKNSQPNLADNLKRTALMKAVQQEQEECVAILLEHGADPNLADAGGNTALHLAVLSKNTAVAGLLLEHNASSDAQNQMGFTPLKLAALLQHEEILECLLKKAADRHAQAQFERTAFVVTGTHEAHLEEDNLRLQEELDRADTELQEEEEKHLQSEHCVRDLKTALDDKEREAITSSPKLQDLLLPSSETNTTLKQLEEHVQHLEIEKTRLEATVQQQSNRIEALQRDLQASASVGELSQQLDMQLEAQNQTLQEELSTLRGKYEKLEKSKCQLQEEVTKVHHRLETFVLDGSQTAQCKREVEERADQEIRQKPQDVSLVLQAQAASQARLGQNGDSHCDSVRIQLEERIRDLESELDRVKKTQQESASRKEAMRGEMEMYKDLYLEELKTRRCLEKKLERLEKLLRVDRRKLRANEETQSQLEEMKNRYSEKVKEVDRLRTEVAELSQQLDRESKKCTQLEAKNQDLQGELSTLRGKCKNLEMDKCQLQEELAKVQHHLETNMVDRTQLEQCKREVEERADHEIRQKLREVNEFLQAQAASQDRLEQIRSSHLDSLKKQLEDRIRDLERAQRRIKSDQPERPFQKESTQAEVEMYKELYLMEAKTRESLAKKLERADERLAEAETKLLWERHRSKSAVTSSAVSIHLAASPLLDSAGLGCLGNSLGLNRSLGFRTPPRHLW
ncbi:ankyrin repeat domain-containing protein 26-like isoform X1 [Manacus candei]|uniref:ankyrin repeat domain-containing protein 26-like isoform X1 n=1 Tax=Manacus candei TaxID=415023 RepID=UPI002227446C|nr:ankyrin repeat domain-containing protein 26-like isoform X1 [Manacus candei]XP_051651402.1 ankyrin repeat domain-containing protein 26-like isoform X2 [Manacus candei]XP_051651404.1 ankyrin repeat domain-containing protein 26-like isoform X3 [Manacus candei]XP_051651405.1 ankyrin repeat domain-containing protein 26-like isoform X4 [Manacus candei]XP_051651406.1 ankyrin repeat domain-containing protein 26-like isoform X5 [Manacus candei]XP_051651407.1 ankyrin repeat domain-containing protein